ncbi:MAG TPA: hypothetical protein VF414_07505 [Thermoanaerobaculia bacterium]
MTREEYEERKRALEAQHLADIALMNVAHQARMRSLESLWETAGPATVSTPPPSRPAPPAPAPKPRRERNSVLDDLVAAFPGLPGTFDKHDIVRALGYEPSRGTLFRALKALLDAGRISNANFSIGGAPNRYRKVSPAG